LFFDDLVTARRLVQWWSVGDHPGGIDLAAFDPAEERPHVPLHVALAGAQGQ
jgi:hypothetical protein